jgi:hypothetical protein
MKKKKRQQTNGLDNLKKIAIIAIIAGAVLGFILGRRKTKCIKQATQK